MDHLRSGLPEGDFERRTLIGIARSAIGAKLGQPERSFPDLPWLRCPQATFVTLTINRDLRGCVGSLLPHQTLVEDVRENALLAAFNDTRFSPVSLNEWRTIKISISLISPMKPYSFTDLKDLEEQISQDREGLFLTWENRSATYLPEVWEQISDPDQFLSELLKKGLIPQEALPPELRAYHYRTTILKEN
ncbi:AMMECR1 domain protein [mine drainage metagenome]|jgi:AmmeMemoRadiSam system protein A|uniref:AMMECR1 domain protein n=1 Tax=mine drainage metagenome TaxID=410659 RepID=T1CCI9_9ZZZZ